MQTFWGKENIFRFGGPSGKVLPTNVGDTEMWVQSLGWEDSLKEDLATHWGILAWRWSHGQRSLVGYSARGHKLDVTEHLSTTTISFKTLSKVQSHSKIPGSLLQYMNLWGHNSSHTRCCLFLLWDKDKDGYQVCGTKTLLDIKEAVYAVACDRCPL